MSRVAIDVGKVPGRKRTALSLTEYHDGGGATTRVLAYFTSEDHARLFIAAVVDRRIVAGDGL